MQDQIAQALFSGMLVPAVGAAAILIAWLTDKLKDDVPLGEQLRAMLPTLKRGFVAAAVSFGGVLLGAEQSGVEGAALWLTASSAGLGAFLSVANFTAPRVPKPAPKDDERPSLTRVK